MRKYYKKILEKERLKESKTKNQKKRTAIKNSFRIVLLNKGTLAIGVIFYYNLNSYTSFFFKLIFHKQLKVDNV